MPTADDLLKDLDRLAQAQQRLMDRLALRDADVARYTQLWEDAQAHLLTARAQHALDLAAADASTASFQEAAAVFRDAADQAHAALRALLHAVGPHARGCQVCKRVLKTHADLLAQVLDQAPLPTEGGPYVGPD